MESNFQRFEVWILAHTYDFCWRNDFLDLLLFQFLGPQVLVMEGEAISPDIKQAKFYLLC